MKETMKMIDNRLQLYAIVVKIFILCIPLLFDICFGRIKGQSSDHLRSDVRQVLQIRLMTVLCRT